MSNARNIADKVCFDEDQKLLTAQNRGAEYLSVKRDYDGPELKAELNGRRGRPGDQRPALSLWPLSRLVANNFTRILVAAGSGKTRVA